jgi:hypothetical protein
MESRLPWRREAFYQQKAHISRALWQRYTKTLTGIASGNPDTRYVRDAIFLPHPVDRSNDASLADIECITRHRNCTHARIIGFQNFMHCNKCGFQNETNRSRSFFCTETNQKKKKKKTRGKQHFPERQPERRFRNFGNQLNSRPQKRKKKEKISKSLLFSLLPPA